MKMKKKKKKKFLFYKYNSIYETIWMFVLYENEVQVGRTFAVSCSMYIDSYHGNKRHKCMQYLNE